MQVFQYRKQDHKQEQLHNRKRWFQFRNLDRKSCKLQRRKLVRKRCHSKPSLASSCATKPTMASCVACSKQLRCRSLELHSRCCKLQCRNLGRHCMGFQRRNLGRKRCKHFQFRNLDRKRFQRRNLGRMLEWCHSSLYRSRHPSS